MNTSAHSDASHTPRGCSADIETPFLVHFEVPPAGAEEVHFRFPISQSLADGLASASFSLRAGGVWCPSATPSAVSERDRLTDEDDVDPPGRFLVDLEDLPDLAVLAVGR
jgi:hypothetical protein